MYQSGDEIDIWVVEKALGQGGMGSVYRCHNRSAKRILAAIKVLDGSLNRIPKIQARFIREAEILFALDHPNIVKVRNVRVDMDPPYLEMEFVDGMSLESRLERGPITVTESVSLLREIASALCYLHAQNIRHRDLKPANIVCQTDGRAKLVDFGIATELDGATLSEHGQAMGSASYVPPEWARPGELDSAKWDIYALGVCIWEALTGHVAFPMPTEGSPSQRFLLTVAQKQSSVPLDPGAHFPLELRILVRDLTHPDPDRRVPSAEALVARVADLDMTTVDPEHRFDAADDALAAARARPRSNSTMVPDDGLAIAVAPAPLKRLTRPAAEPTFNETTGVFERAQKAASPPAAPLVAAPKPGRSLAALLGVGAVAVAGLAGLAIATFVATRPDPEPVAVVPPQPRALAFIVSGVPAGVPVQLSLDGTILADTGGRWSAGIVSVGPHALNATLGANCGEPVATWCKQVSRTVTVSEGDGEQTEVAQLPAPEARAVTLMGVSGAQIEGVGDARKVPGGRQFDALLPGTYAAVLADGRTIQVEVPWAAGALILPIAPASPEAVAATASPPGTGTTTAVVTPQVAVPHADPDPAPASTAAARAGTVGSFATWLKTHPDWEHDAAIAAGQAEEGYLKGWTGAEPPPGQSDRALVGISWTAANAYCKGRGGLADAAAEPTTWQESASQPWHEYRQQGGAPAWRRADGTVSTAVSRTSGNVVTGFRCAK